MIAVLPRTEVVSTAGAFSSKDKRVINAPRRIHRHACGGHMQWVDETSHDEADQLMVQMHTLHRTFDLLTHGHPALLQYKEILQGETLEIQRTKALSRSAIRSNRYVNEFMPITMPMFAARSGCRPLQG